MKNTSVMALCLLAFALGGCATNTAQIAKKDYSAYRAADPKTILILPPKNTSPDVAASYGFYSNTQAPVAESGYYVLPISLVDEQFKSNGLTVVDDIHQVDFRKLREVFGADAALYITVTDYGTRYLVIDSVTTVTAQARLVDLKTGRELWAGRASANSNEGGGNSGGGLIGMLVSAALSQIVNSVGDAGHGMAKVTAGRLLSAGGSHSMLPGPRSPAYPKQKVQPATAAAPVAP